MSFPIAALITEAKRELRKRYEVYPRLVARGSLTKARMDELIALQRAIIANLEAQRNRGQHELCGAALPQASE